MQSVRQSREAVRALRNNAEHDTNDPAVTVIRHPDSSALANWMTFALFVSRERPRLSTGSSSQVVGDTSVTVSRKTLEPMKIGSSFGLLERDVDSHSLDYLQIPYRPSFGTILVVLDHCCWWTVL